MDRHRGSAGTRREVKYARVGAQYRFGLHALALNLMQRDVQGSVEGERKRAQLAWMYALSRRSQLQAFIDNDGIDSSKSDVRVRAIGAGIRHGF